MKKIKFNINIPKIEINLKIVIIYFFLTLIYK